MTSCYFGSLRKCCHWGHSKRLGLSGWLHARMSRHLTFQWIYPPSATWGTCAGFPWSLENMRTTKGILGPLKGLCTGSWSFHPPLHIYMYIYMYVSVQFSRSVVSDSLRPHELQHARPPCPSPTPRVHPNSCPLCRWCHPTISFSVIPFSSCPQSFPASGSFQMSQLFTSGGLSIGVSASTSVFPKNTRDRFLLGWTGWISLQSKRFPRVFSNTTFQKHQFFGVQLSL